ncbi:2-aminoadipate transaminase-like [Periplaneta americana]|uniref:2-aminoadipate transaminase-like n=1 Tax=Periplaneta americana TaxID=6978 RepID=UPI0037E88AAC
MADADKIQDPHLYHLFDGEPVLNVYKADITNLSAGTPGPDLLKHCIDMFQQATVDRMAKEEKDAFLFQYGITSGLWEFREELAKFLTVRYGETVHRQNLILTCGATHGLLMALTTLIQPNGIIFVEEATYMIALDVLKQFTGMKIVTVPIDSEGVDVEAMEKIVRDEKSKGSWTVSEEKPFWAMFYTIPIFHNPTGTKLPKNRCDALVRAARSLDFLVVCDDVYNLLYYGNDPHPPKRLFSHDAVLEGYSGGHVISNCSFSKIMAPGVRVGWIEAPARLANIFRSSGYLRSGGGVNQYMAGVITSILEMGLEEKLLNHLVQTFKERMAIVCSTLDEFLPSNCSFIRPEGGYFVWITVPEHADMNIFVPWCQKNYKISAIPGTKFSVNGKCKNYLRLAIAFHNKEMLKDCTKRLCTALLQYLTTNDLVVCV